MDSRDKAFLDLFGLVKSWIPWRSEPPGVSRDFWMPDQSCRVCYDCDSQFTVLNRRHHCRLCGRVFCAKCTSNSVPVPYSESSTGREEWEKIRVCNYCYKQWQNEATSFDNGIQDSNKSPSVASFASSKSSGTVSSSILNIGSTQHSSVTGHRERADSPVPSLTQTTEMDDIADKQDLREPERIHVENMNYQDSKHFMNRSDDDEEEYGLYRSDSESRHFVRENDCFGKIDKIIENVSTKNSLDRETVNFKTLSSSPSNNCYDQGIERVNSNYETYIDDEGLAPSSMYPVVNVDSEPVDFENNAVLWLPPEPEDEEDEKDGGFFYDEEEDDNGNPSGEWGRLSSSNSFCHGEFRSRDKSTEEHRMVMKNVVDGHFRALVAQLLQVENVAAVDEDGKDIWLDIITFLSWEAATLLKPDMSKGGGMDPGGYVKVKCVASGRRSDSMVVKGVVCKKNVAHRRMISKLEKPRILILGGALEYQRVTNHLSSLDTLLQQEMDYLKMAVAKIDAQQPDILLVEKSVSRFAQDCLLAKDISLVLNIKRPLLERISRCSGAQIIPSIDQLSSSRLGYCESFYVKRFFEDLGSAGQGGKKLAKTLMYFEGCPKPFGYTILLRGANGDELKKVKHVVQYGVFAAYHLALETSFLADEGASLPELPLNSPITVALPDKSLTIERSISTVSGYCVSGINKPLVSLSEHARSNSVPLQGQDHTLDAGGELSKFGYTLNSGKEEVNSLSDVYPRIMLTNVQRDPLCDKVTDNCCQDSCDVIRQYTGADVSDASPFLERNILDDVVPVKEDFPPSPSDHQSILVSLSSRCVWKGSVCERAHLFRIKYYGSFDKPLGRFLRDHLFDQGYTCHSCEMPSEAHVHCYTHRQGTLTISVKKLPDILLPGEKDGKIWMWHRCLKCPRTNNFPPATRRVVMSDAAWGLSFGKFLELSFSNHAAASRVASCGHSLHRDCLRFYGFGKMVACFRYASIDVFSVYVPPPKIDFKYNNQDWIEEEIHKLVDRAELLFSEVLNALSQIEEDNLPISGTKLSETRRQISEFESLLQREKADFEDFFKKIRNQELKKGQHAVDILDINRLQRQLLVQSYIWDRRLIYVAKLVKRSDTANGLYVDNESKGIPYLEKGLDDVGKGLSKDEYTHVDHGIVGAVSRCSSADVQRRIVDESFVSEQSRDSVANLSDTLDAAWTGKNNLIIGILKDGSLGMENLDAENHLENGKISSLTVEDSNGWLKSPFSNFYWSLNKMTLGEYNPSYISSIQELYGARLLLPVGTNETVVPVFEDEPTSIISYVLASAEYQNQLIDEGDFIYPAEPLFSPALSFDEAVSDSHKGVDESFLSMSSSRSSVILDPLSYNKALHARVSFEDDGKVRYTVTCYYAKRFDALRKICCPSELDYIRSLSRCKKWGAQGGKSNVFFAKTLDERFIVKQVTKTELESFIKFGPEYFKYLSESIGSRSPTCLAKILGIYQVTAKHVKGGKESKMDLLVMENLLFERHVTRLYDLKGSSRSRYNPDANGSNKVLLDQNLIEAMPTCPIFVGNKAKRLLERAVWNDTSFLASIDVMDYSLLVGVDEEKHELVVGIIDFMRQYTWDKHLETWVKASGILGGLKNSSPTVISPKQYKKRFRKAMTAYFLMVPDQWSPPSIVPSKSQSDLSNDHDTAPPCTC